MENNPCHAANRTDASQAGTQSPARKRGALEFLHIQAVSGGGKPRKAGLKPGRSQ
jgi:hypothetical protein